MIIYRRKDNDVVIPCGLGPVFCPDTSHNLQMKTVDSSTVLQHVEPDSGYYGLYRVIINPLTDDNLLPGNIRAGVTILGVLGTYSGELINLQAKTVDPTLQGLVVSADIGYDGLSSVTVNPVTADIDPDIQAGNIKRGVEILGVTGTFDGGPLQSKSVNSSTVSQSVTPDPNYYGLSQVTVSPYTVEGKSQTITQNGTYTFAPTSADALSDVSISVQVAGTPATVQAKSVSYNVNGEYTVTPDQGYDGLSSVTVDVSVEGQVINNQNKTVNPSTNSQSITADSGYTGLGTVTVNPMNLQTGEYDPYDYSYGYTEVNPSTGYDGLSKVKVYNPVTRSITINPSTNVQVKTPGEYAGEYITDVTVNAVTASIDPDIQAGNIKKDVEILGVVGTYEGTAVNNQNKTVDSSTISQTITSDSGYTGLGTVTVNPYTVETDSSVLTSNGTYTFTPATADALSSVTVDVSVNSGGGSDTVYLDAFEISRKTGANAYIPTDYTPNASVNRIHGFVRGKAGSGESLRLIYTYGNYCDCYTHGVSFVLEFGSGWNNRVSFTTTDANLSNGIAFDAVLTGSKWSVTVNGVTKTCTDATGSETMWGLQLLGYDYTAMSYITFETDTDSWTFSPVAVANVSNNVINAYTGLYIKQVHTVSGVDTVTYVTQDNNGNALSSSYDFVTYEDNISTGEIIDLSGQSFGSTYTFETGNYPSGVVIPAARLQNRTVSSSTNSQTVTKTGGYYYGLDTVTINPYTLDSKTVNSSTAQQVVNSSADGLSSVTVNPYTVETNSSTLTANGTYTITPQNADALSSVTIDVSVDGQVINNQNKTVDPSTSGQTITADSGYTGLGTVTVNPVNAVFGTYTITQNGTYGFDGRDFGGDYIDFLQIDVSVGSSGGDWYTEWKLGNKHDLSDVNLTQVMNSYQGACANMFATINNSNSSYATEAASSAKYITNLPIMDASLVHGYGMFNQAFAFATFTNTNQSGTGLEVSFPNLTNINGSLVFYRAFYKVKGDGIRKISFPELESLGSDTQGFAQSVFTEFFSSDNPAMLEEVYMPKFKTVYGGEQGAFNFTNFVDDPSGASRKLTVHVDALQYRETTNANVARYFGNSLTTLVVNGTATHNVYITSCPNISADSVLSVLQSLGTSGSGLSVNFASGLTVTDDVQGSIQTAYNTAVSRGWTINNLTITPYSA